MLAQLILEQLSVFLQQNQLSGYFCLEIEYPSQAEIGEALAFIARTSFEGQSSPLIQISNIEVKPGDLDTSPLVFVSFAFPQQINH